MARIVNRFLRIAALLAMAIAAASFASPVTASELGFGVGATARVTAVRFYTELRQNVADLAGTFTSGASYEANFLTNFDRTGGVERWGFPTSAIFEETAGTLTQYYQRGVVDWKPSPSGDRHTFQRRLAWDHLGGGLGSSVDQGVETGLRNPNPGEAIGPWGHKVADLSVEGVSTGFADFFHRLGGVSSFGYPKTDARRDNHPQAVLHDPARPVDSRIRQYFQAAVLEFHPESPGAPVKLRLLGDTLRNRKYPNDAWQQYPAFTSKPAFSVGDEARVDLLATQDPGSQGPQDRSVAAVVEALRPSLLRIETDKACGSGFFITGNGWAVTAWHVVEDARSVNVTTAAGHQISAYVAAGDASLDLALLGLPGVSEETPVTWGDSDALALGSQVVAMGYGRTLTDVGPTCPPNPTVTTGLLSNRLALTRGEFLQTDAALSPGNSGGPVTTMNGQVVGIVVGTVRDTQNTNLLTPSSRLVPVIRAWLEAIRRGEALPTPPTTPGETATPTPTSAPTPTAAPTTPPRPGSQPVVLVESALEYCYGADRAVYALGRNLELTAAVTIKSPPTANSFSIPIIRIRNAYDDWGEYDAITFGFVIPSHGIPYIAWDHRKGDDTSTRKFTAARLSYDFPFHIRFAYDSGSTDLFVNGEIVHSESNLPYGDEIYLDLSCISLSQGATMLYSDVRITGVPLPNN